MDKNEVLLDEILEYLAQLKCEELCIGGSWEANVYTEDNVETVIGNIRDSIKRYRADKWHESVLRECAK